MYKTDSLSTRIEDENYKTKLLSQKFASGKFSNEVSTLNKHNRLITCSAHVSVQLNRSSLRDEHRVLYRSKELVFCYKYSKTKKTNYSIGKI